MGWGRVYFAAQALAGAAWWISVALSPLVRESTLGSLDPVLLALVDIPLFVIASALAAAGLTWAAWVATGWTLLVSSSLAVFATVTSEAGVGALLMLAAAGGSLLAFLLVTRGAVPIAWIAAGPFRFRPVAAQRSTAALLATTLGQIVVFWGFFLGVVPAVVAFIEHRWGLHVPLPMFVSYTGAAVLVIASALGIWSALAMCLAGKGTPLPAAMATDLVVVGPYRWVRNPMAVAGIAQGIAVGLMFSSWLVVAYAMLGSLLWNYAVRPLEEADLEQRFGAPYVRYRDAVRCWLPTRPSAPLAPAVTD